MSVWSSASCPSPASRSRSSRTAAPRSSASPSAWASSRASTCARRDRRGDARMRDREWRTVEGRGPLRPGVAGGGGRRRAGAVTGHLRISKRTRVGEVHGRLDIEPVVVGVAEELMAEVTDLESAGRFGREVGAHVCRDLMGPPVHLTRDSTVADAFRAMHEHQYSGLPVVDDQMQVVGYVDLLELALRYLDQLPASSAPEALLS